MFYIANIDLYLFIVYIFMYFRLKTIRNNAKTKNKIFAAVF